MKTLHKFTQKIFMCILVTGSMTELVNNFSSDFEIGYICLTKSMKLNSTTKASTYTNVHVYTVSDFMVHTVSDGVDI